MTAAVGARSGQETQAEAPAHCHVLIAETWQTISCGISTDGINVAPYQISFHTSPDMRPMPYLPIGERNKKTESRTEKWLDHSTPVIQNTPFPIRN